MSRSEQDGISFLLCILRPYYVCSLCSSCLCSPQISFLSFARLIKYLPYFLLFYFSFLFFLFSLADLTGRFGRPFIIFVRPADSQPRIIWFLLANCRNQFIIHRLAFFRYWQQPTTYDSCSDGVPRAKSTTRTADVPRRNCLLTLC